MQKADPNQSPTQIALVLLFGLIIIARAQYLKLIADAKAGINTGNKRLSAIDGSESIFGRCSHILSLERN